MKKYYTRACNFFYGLNSKKLIKKKLTLPLCGDNNISFNQIEIFIRDKKKIKSKIININNIGKLPLFIKKKITQDIKQITSKSNLVVQKYNQPDQQEPENKNPLINRIKEVVEENSLAVEETKIIPQEKASERQARLSLIRTTFKYPLLIFKCFGI